MMAKEGFLRGVGAEKKIMSIVMFRSQTLYLASDLYQQRTQNLWIIKTNQDEMGTRPVGKPRQRWQEDFMEDLKKLKVKNWKEAAKDRRTWRDLAEKAKTHKGL